MTVAGFWIGRYGETTARDRFHAPYVSVAVVTGLYSSASSSCNSCSASRRLPTRWSRGFRSALLINLLLTLPVYALVRRLFPPQQIGDRIREVRLLG